tara:strand:+ start:17485 stop:18810 length:1326 start_codon:yes stop_codon:yes gene_type:complete
MVLRLVLVRHGLSTFNKKGLIQGRTDKSYLTKEGFLQAKLTGDALNEITFDKIYSSPLLRASETAKEIEKCLNSNHNIEYDEKLLEVDLDKWSGLAIKEIKTKYKESYQLWKNDPENLCIKRNDDTIYQPIQDLFLQAREFIINITKNIKNNSDQSILIVAHNAILRCIILDLLNRPSKGFRKIKLDNASISIINIYGDKNFDVQIDCINQTSHLNKNIPSKVGDSRIILVRHGETDWNKEGRFQGQIDIPLNSTGREQANKAAKYLQNINFTKAFSSKMERPYETAQIILKNANDIYIQKISELIEINHGLWEGKLEKEINLTWPKMLTEWHIKPETVVMPEGESIKEVADRANFAWKKICESQEIDDTTLVVAHDAVNKTLICNILGLDISDIWKIKQGNGGITIIDIFKDPEKENILISLNITTHLGQIIDSTAMGAL